MRNRFMIRKLALMLALVLTFTTVGMHLGTESILAATFSYSLNTDGTYTLAKYTGTATSVTIPNTYNGAAVTAIGEHAFYNNKTIQYVTLPTNHHTIYARAFNQCSSLKQVYNSEYADTIYPGTFGGCTSLTSFKFSNRLTVLGDSTFRNTGLTEVFLPASVRSLQLYVFGSCPNLKKVTIVNANCSFLNETAFGDGTSENDGKPTLCGYANSSTYNYALTYGFNFIVYNGSSGEQESESSTGSSENESSSSSSGSGECNHTYWIEDWLDPTCTTDGYDEYMCEHCLDTYRDIVPATGHNAGDWVVVKEATASEDGLRCKYCTECDAVVESEFLPKTGSTCTHPSYTYSSTKTAATCTTTGIDIYKCTSCDATKEVTTESFGGHNYQYSSTTTKPTCQNTGVDIYKCSRCTSTENRTTNKIDHIYGDFVTDVEPTYTTKGEKSKHCSMCNSRTEITEIPMLVCSSHNYQYTRTTRAATCTVDGIAIHTCTICSGTTTVTLSATGHNYQYSSTTTKPTCISTGMDVHKCTNCGSTKNVTTNTISHNYGSFVTDIEPTYTTKGEKSKHCTMCDARTEITEIAMLVCNNHNYKYTSTITQSSCTSNGSDLYTCSICGGTKTETTAMTSHVYGDWIVDVDSTPTSEGQKSKHCVYCGHKTEITSIPKSECTHNYQYTKTTAKATCTSTGTDLYTCSVCFATKNVTTPTVSHNYGDFVTDIKATYTSEGEKSKYCSECNSRTEVTKIPMLVCNQHNFQYTSTTSKATCTSTGTDIHTCSICGTTKNVSTPVISHVYGDWIIDKEATTTSTGEKSKYCIYCQHRTDITTIPVIETVIAGDADGDGTVNVNDAITYKLYLAGAIDELDIEACDVSGDGKLSIVDAVIIMKYLAGVTDAL